jgi:hypothetical protein
MRLLLTLCVCALAVSCSKTNGRYTAVKTEDGFVRLDTVSGEMVAVDRNVRASVIKTKDFHEPQSAVRPFPDSTLAIGDQQRTMQLVTRWKNGQLEWRMNVFPFSTHLVTINMIGSLENTLSVLFLDGDGYPVCEATPYFAGGHTQESAGQNGLRLSGSNDLTKEDYLRITTYEIISNIKQAEAKSKR